MSLSYQEIAVAAGWVLQQNRIKSIVKYTHIEKNIEEWFGVCPSNTTIRRLCERNGLRMKKIISKGPDVKADQAIVYGEMIKCITDMRSRDLFTDPWADMCVDFIHNSHYNTSVYGVGATGKLLKLNFSTNKQAWH